MVCATYENNTWLIDAKTKAVIEFSYVVEQIKWNLTLRMELFYEEMDS